MTGVLVSMQFTHINASTYDPSPFLTELKTRIWTEEVT